MFLKPNKIPNEHLITVLIVSRFGELLSNSTLRTHSITDHSGNRAEYRSKRFHLTRVLWFTGKKKKKTKLNRRISVWQLDFFKFVYQ